VNYEGILEIADYIVRIIENTGERKIEFAKTKQEQSRTAAKYKVTLGVMPDYTHTGEGMKIDGVLDGRAAMKGGLEAGDVILKIGDMNIKNIYDYMEGLSKYKAGDSAKVVVRRGEGEKEFTVTF
jgi:S1-C subfamily serine protease